MKTWKVFLGIGIAALVIGIAILLIGLALNGWKFSVDYEMLTFTSTADNNALDVDISAGAVSVEYYDGESFEINYPSSYRHGYTVTENNGKIKVAPKRSWGLWFGWNKIPDMTVKIPQGKIIDFSLGMSAGTANVADGEFKNFELEMSAGMATVGKIKCNGFDASLSAGKLAVDSVDCAAFDLNLSAGTASVDMVRCDNIEIDLSAGSAQLKVSGKKEDYTIRVDKSAGSCNLVKQQGAVAGRIIDVDLSAGSVNVTFTD